MEAFIPLLKNVIIFVALAVPGFILVKTKQLKAEQSNVLSTLLMYVGLPFMILSNTISIDFTPEIVITLVFVLILSIVLHFVFFFISLLFFKNKPDNQKGMLRFCAIFANTGFLGIPLISAVFGFDSIIVTYMVVLNIICNLMMYTLGTFMVSGDKKCINLKGVLLNPVLIAFVVGVILNLLGVKKLIPEVVSYSDHFKNIVTPIAMTILGMKLGNIDFKDLFTSKDMYLTSILKLVLMPIAGAIITFAIELLFNLDATNVILTMLLAFSMPTAGLASAFADKYNGDSHTAAICTLGSTLLSVIAIPLLYMLFCLIAY